MWSEEKGSSPVTELCLEEEAKNYGPHRIIVPHRARVPARESGGAPAFLTQVRPKGQPTKVKGQSHQIMEKGL